MKKIVLGVMLLIGIGSAQVSAQSISGGVKVEANMSNFLLSDMSGAKSKMGFGVSVLSAILPCNRNYYSISKTLKWNKRTERKEILNIGV